MVKVNVAKVKSINKKHKNEIFCKAIKSTKSEKQETISKTFKKNVEKTKGEKKNNIKHLLIADVKKNQTKCINKTSVKPKDLNDYKEQNLHTVVKDKKRKAHNEILIEEKKQKLKKNIIPIKLESGEIKATQPTNVKTITGKDEKTEITSKQKKIGTSTVKMGTINENVKKIKDRSEAKAVKKAKIETNAKNEKETDISQISGKGHITSNYSKDHIDEVQREDQKNEDTILEEEILNIEFRNEIKFKNAKVKPLTEEAFDDILSKTKIENVCKAFETLLQSEINKVKNLVVNEYRYMLNVTSYKIPNCPKHMVKLNLRHSLVDIDKDDVVLIVADLKRGAKVDYDPTIQHYQDLLQEAGVSGNLKIRPFNQVRNECKTYEGKRKFANSFDYFMCDGRIVSHLNGYCGKVMQKPRTTVHAVRMDNPKKLKGAIEQSLKRTAYRQLEKGDLIAIPVGHSRLTTTELTENIKYVIEQLKKVYPGSYENIRHMYLRADIRGTSAIPLFINLAEPPQRTPQVIGPREQRLLDLKSKANKILKKFNLSKSATVVKLNKSAIMKKTTLTAK